MLGSVSGTNCPSCGIPTAPGDVFCAKCGASLDPLAPPPPGLYPMRGSRRPTRRLVVSGAVLVVLLLVGLTYWLVIYEPANDVVTTQNGVWVVNGASGSLVIQIGCSNCGSKPAPSSHFTIDVNVAVSSTSCSGFGCPYYSVQSFSINAPYTLDQVAPNNLPFTEAPGSFDTWALTLTAPSSSGHYPLGGVVAVGYD
jgi:Double zinc ribbon